MNKIGIFSIVALLTVVAQASWYWPFGSGDSSGDEPRLSELMEPASVLIDEASDLAGDGKISESIEKYREALRELDKVEAENPERAKKPEFASLRNKRAYVNAAIDSMLMAQIKNNARSVAVSDTTALERRLAEERSGKSGKTPPASAEEPAKKETTTLQEKPQPKPEAVQKPVAKTKKEQAISDMMKGDYAAATISVDEMLVANPNDPVALNLRAAIAAAQNRFKEAEQALDQAIMSNPRNHYAYYNMAKLLLQIDPGNKSTAKRYYETGRALGGPEDKELEGGVK